MSETIWNKLNLGDHKKIFVLNAPKEFNQSLKLVPKDVAVRENVGTTKQVDFILIFVQQQEQIAKHVDKLSRAKGDAIVWFAYPKKSSKTYQSNINRDDGWQPIGKAGFEGVRQVAIDDDWSALRFRRVEFIKSMTRSKKMAISEAGKERVRKKKSTSKTKKQK